MLKALLIHLLALGAVAGVAMIIPVGFVWMIVAGRSMDADASDFVRIFGSVLMPFGMALWSCAIWRERARPWLTFFITAVVIVAMLKFGVYDVEVR